MTTSLRPLMLGLVGLVGTFVAWQVATSSMNSIFFPTPVVVLERALAFWPTTPGVESIALSLRNLGVGLLLGISFGITLGLVIGRIPSVRYAATPLLDFARSVPSTALIPFALGVFGLSVNMQVFLICYGAAWPVLLSTVDGVRGIHPTLLDTATVYRVGTRYRIWAFIVPAVIPRIATGVKLAVPIGLMLMVTSELIGSNAGIGFQIVQAQATFRYVDMWSGIVLLALIGFLLTWAFSFVERVLARTFPTGENN